MTAEATDVEGPDQGVLLLDASCLLNLYATGRLLEVAQALPWQLAVVDYVMEQEALFVRTIEQHEEQGETVPVDLSQFIDGGLILVVSLEGPGEQAYFVELAAELDDGEAMTGAIAINRGFAVAIDDRKARRVLERKDPGLRLVSTLELVHRWSVGVSGEEVNRALQAMRYGAWYVPGNRDPLYGWWRNMVEGPIDSESGQDQA